MFLFSSLHLHIPLLPPPLCVAFTAFASYARARTYGCVYVCERERAKRGRKRRRLRLCLSLTSIGVERELSCALTPRPNAGLTQA